MWIVFWVLSSSPVTTTADSTIFGFKGDRLAGGVYDEKTLGVAHRSLPWGGTLRLSLTKNGRTRSVNVRVIDRGPWGRLDKHGRWYNGASSYRRCNKKYRACKRAGREGCVHPLDESCYAASSRWRGGLDILPAAARALGHDGWETVTIHYWLWPPPRPPPRNRNNT